MQSYLRRMLQTTCGCGFRFHLKIRSEGRGGIGPGRCEWGWMGRWRKPKSETKWRNSHLSLKSKPWLCGTHMYRSIASISLSLYACAAVPYISHPKFGKTPRNFIRLNAWRYYIYLPTKATSTIISIIIMAHISHVDLRKNRNWHNSAASPFSPGKITERRKVLSL